MDTTLSDTMPSAKSPHVPATDHAEGAPKAPSRATYTLLDGIKLASGLIAVARGLEPVLTMLRVAGLRDPLSWVGLARRRSPLATLALFGAGLAAGAGAALLLAPGAGVELRRTLLKGWKEDAEPALANVESQAEKAAARARDAAPIGGHRDHPWVSERTVAIQDSPGAHVDVAAETAKATSSAAKAAPPAPPDHEHAALIDGEVGKPTRANGAAGYRFG